MVLVKHAREKTSPPQEIKLRISSTPSLFQNQRSLILFSSPIIVILLVLLVIKKVSRSKSDSKTQNPTSATIEDPQIFPSEEKSAGRIISNIFIFILVAALLSSSAFLIYKVIREKGSPAEPDPQETIQLPIHIPTPTPTPKIVRQPISTPTPYVDDQTYACGPGGACNSYENPKSSGCTVTFTDRYCEDRCSDISVRCRY